jgi:hypothetical protein
MPRVLAAIFALLVLNGSLAHATVRNFFAPEVNGQRLDSCLTGASDCGKPAADAFCKKEGYDNAVLFQREPVMASLRLDGGSCTGASCKSFKQIKCFTEKSDMAAVQN